MSRCLRLGLAIAVVSSSAIPSVGLAEPPAEPQTRRPEPAEGAAASPAPGSTSPLRSPLVTSRLARDCVTAALRAAGYPGAQQHLSSMGARARSSALLPEVWLRASRSTDESLRLSPTLDDPYRYSEAGGAGFLLEARLIWHLDRVLFDRDELSVERLRGDRADAAAKLAAKVVETLFAWQRAALRISDPKLAVEEQEQAALAAAESAVVLDVLTNGWFGERALRGAR